MGLACLTEFCQQRRHRACWVSPNSPMPFWWSPGQSPPTRSALGSCAPMPIPAALSGDGESSLRLQLPSRVLPLQHRETRRYPIDPGACLATTARSFRGFFPCSVFPAMGSHIPR
jgi:hypothetical protein